MEIGIVRFSHRLQAKENLYFIIGTFVEDKITTTKRTLHF